MVETHETSLPLVASLLALVPWAPPAERGPLLGSIYGLSLTVALCEGNKIIILVQNSSKTTKKFFTFDVSTSIRGLHQKKLVLGLLLPVLGAIS